MSKQDVIEEIQMLQEDGDVPKGVKAALTDIVQVLQDDELGAPKALDKITELMDADIPSFVRTELWNISSMLESM